MTQQEALQIAKPVLFNTAMVEAIQNGDKTATRRILKTNKVDLSNCEFEEMSVDPSEIRVAKNGEEYPHDLKGLYATFVNADGDYFPLVKSPYQIGDILYVRETFQENYDGTFSYRAGHVFENEGGWKPSIHMPKQAARIFLRIVNVKAARLQDMMLDDFLAEGIVLRPEAFNDPENAYGQARTAFSKLWDSTVPKFDLSQYGWAANPWVWVITFEKVEVE